MLNDKEELAVGLPLDPSQKSGGEKELCCEMHG